MKMSRKIFSLILIMSIVLGSATDVMALDNGVSSTYVLRYTPNVPGTECVYEKTWSFYASRTTTTMTATQTTSSGASVMAVSSNGIAGILDVKGVSYSAPAVIGKIYVASATLKLNDTSTQKIGQGKITG